MSMLLAVVSTVTSTPMPTPSPVVVQKTIETIKEVPVTPDYINQLLWQGALFAAGWAGSWIQAFINSHKKLGEKLNILVTSFYAVAGAAVVLYFEGQLDLSSPTKVLTSIAVVLLAAWVRHNGGKLTKSSQTAPNEPAGALSGTSLNAAALADQLIPKRSNE